MKSLKKERDAVKKCKMRTKDADFLSEVIFAKRPFHNLCRKDEWMEAVKAAEV